jgi:hypothetical protein
MAALWDAATEPAGDITDLTDTTVGWGLFDSLSDITDVSADGGYVSYTGTPPFDLQTIGELLDVSGGALIMETWGVLI